MALLALVLVLASASSITAAPTLLFVTDTSSTNDVLAAASKGAAAVPTKTFATVASALASASNGDGLLIMADGMLPADPGDPTANANATMVVTVAEWAAIKAKNLKVYLEFPRSAPAGSAPLEMGQTLWERAAVSVPAGLGEELPYLALIHPHKKVDYVKLPTAWRGQHTSIVIAKARDPHRFHRTIPPPDFSGHPLHTCAASPPAPTALGTVTLAAGTWKP
jgi:hypothetical protein